MKEVIDLTSSPSSSESEHKEGTSPSVKKAKINIPAISPAGSDRPPKLQIETYIPTPSFNLTELVASSLRSSSISPPPVLLREEEQPKTPANMPRIIRVEGSVSIKRNVSPVEDRDGSEEQGIALPVEVRKRIARASSTSSEAQQIKSKLNSTINALKSQSKETKEKNIKLKYRIQAAGSGTSARRVRAKRGTKRFGTPDQIAKLEARFAENPNPKASELLLITEETDLSMRDVKLWFGAQRKKCGNSGFSDGEGERRSFPQPGPSGIQNLGPANYVRLEPGLTSPKFLKKPEDRLSDCELIRRDINRVAQLDPLELQRLLKDKWEIKADRILCLVTSHDYGEFKAKIFKEARRIVEIASNVNPFSEQQENEIEQWKESFILKACQQYKETSEIQIRDFVEQTIMPWVGPFVYSKITIQDGRMLSLLVGLTDFCKISTDDSEGSTWKWETPTFLQGDDPRAIYIKTTK